jgi:lipopolysaccharide assembly protein A
MQTYWIAALAFGILVAIFAVQNSMPITVGFLWLSMENVAVSVVILVSAALGAVITGLFGLGREVRYRPRRR